jgi:hypothetical protein
VSEAQRFYQQGLRLSRAGDATAARQVWRNLVRAFEPVEAEQEWVQLAKKHLARLPPASEDHRWDSVREALKRARKLRHKGHPEEAEEIWRGIEGLYWNDPSAQEVLAELRHDRGDAEPAGDGKGD